jgi:predicted DNA-binding transcriptional regulator YafY
VTKSSEAEQARRVNVTFSLLQQRTSRAEVLEGLVARYGLSRRQAYRYLQQAQRAVSPVPVPEPKAVFTVKLPHSLIVEVRRRARQERCPIGRWVERAVRLELNHARGHG